jgi:outer membrane lipoprotein-sorting protein
MKPLNNICRYFIFAAFIPIALGITGWANNWEDIQKAAARVASLKANFVQKKVMKILAKPLISEGRFFYRNPNNLRWEYSTPLKSILLMHNGNIKRYIWINGQYAEDSGVKLEALGIVMEQILNWLNGQFIENKTFVPSLIPGSPSKIELLPQDKSMVNFIKRIVIELSEMPGIIQSVEIMENENSSTFIEFNNVEMNIQLPDQLFKNLK